MGSKKIHRSSIVGEQGINLIQRVVLGMGYVWYPTGGVEAGIDGFIEIRDVVTGEVTDSIVQVQSRAGPSSSGQKRRPPSTPMTLRTSSSSEP